MHDRQARPLLMRCASDAILMMSYLAKFMLPSNEDFGRANQRFRMRFPVKHFPTILSPNRVLTTLKMIHRETHSETLVRPSKIFVWDFDQCMNIHLMSRPISFQPVGRCAIFGFVFLGHKITRCISHIMRHISTDSVPVGWSMCDATRFGTGAGGRTSQR